MESQPQFSGHDERIKKYNVEDCAPTFWSLRAKAANTTTKYMSTITNIDISHCMDVTVFRTAPCQCFIELLMLLAFSCIAGCRRCGVFIAKPFSIRCGRLPSARTGTRGASALIVAAALRRAQDDATRSVQIRFPSFRSVFR